MITKYIHRQYTLKLDLACTHCLSSCEFGFTLAKIGQLKKSDAYLSYSADDDENYFIMFELLPSLNAIIASSFRPSCHEECQRLLSDTRLEFV